MGKHVKTKIFTNLGTYAIKIWEVTEENGIYKKLATEIQLSIYSKYLILNMIKYLNDLLVNSSQYIPFTVKVQIKI